MVDFDTEFKIKNLNDLLIYLSEKEVSKDNYISKQASEMLVLGSFAQQGTEEGFVFSSKIMLENLMKMTKSTKLNNVMLDGTYKIVINKWVLITVGTTSVIYNFERNKYVQTFIPIFYSFMKTEKGSSIRFFKFF